MWFWYGFCVWQVVNNNCVGFVMVLVVWVVLVVVFWYCVRVDVVCCFVLFSYAFAMGVV